MIGRAISDGPVGSPRTRRGIRKVSTHIIPYEITQHARLVRIDECARVPIPRSSPFFIVLRSVGYVIYAWTPLEKPPFVGKSGYGHIWQQHSSDHRHEYPCPGNFEIINPSPFHFDPFPIRDRYPNRSLGVYYYRVLRRRSQPTRPVPIPAKSKAPGTGAPGNGTGSAGMVNSDSVAI